MLFPYKHIDNHGIYKLQEWIDKIFLDVWCKADPKVDYHINLLPDDVKEVILEIYYDDRIKTSYLYEPIEEVYKIFQGLDQAKKDTLIKAYKDNNSIGDICKNQNECQPFRYSNLKEIDEELSNIFESFFKNLFTNVIKLKAVTSRIGDINIHFKDFVKLNDENKCPFCGINDLKGQYSERREAYDHYLPKSTYPFNSINFFNLAPMCHECNSTFKGTKDPLLKKDKSTRRKAFYPYDPSLPEISLTLILNTKDLDSLRPEDIELNISAMKHNEEVEAWKDVFGIEERYKEKCLSRNHGKYWYQKATDEYENLPDETKQKISRDEWVEIIIRGTETNKFAEANFIKLAYLKACQANGLLPSKPKNKGCLTFYRKS